MARTLRRSNLGNQQKRLAYVTYILSALEFLCGASNMDKNERAAVQAPSDGVETPNNS